MIDELETSKICRLTLMPLSRQSHNTTETRKEMAKLYDSQFANIADYDCFSQSVFESVDSLVRMKEDPFYEEFVRDDHEHFADTKKTRYVSLDFSLVVAWNPILSCLCDFLLLRSMTAIIVSLTFG